jgi:NTP pyrophosphatase (non-canonical NTP hydrolase)
MADPITGAAIGGVANAVGSKVIEAIIRGEDDHEEWLEQVVDVAAEVEAVTRYYGDSIYSEESKKMDEIIEHRGRQIQKLAVIGERLEYSREEIKAVKRLANICGKIGKIESGIDLSETNNEELRDCVSDIFAFVNHNNR